MLGHGEPVDYSDYLRQRVYTNYFAAALMMPQKETVKFLKNAKAEKDLAIEDVRDAFGVSYESAAHRFTNLATEHLGITCHFQKVHESGIIYKAYENDGVSFPTDHTGAIEGQPVCRFWTSRQVFDVEDKFNAFNQYTDTPSGTFWCTARVESGPSGTFSRKAVSTLSPNSLASSFMNASSSGHPSVPLNTWRPPAMMTVTRLSAASASSAAPSRHLQNSMNGGAAWGLRFRSRAASSRHTAARCGPGADRTRAPRRHFVYRSRE